MPPRLMAFQATETKNVVKNPIRRDLAECYSELQDYRKVPDDNQTSASYAI